MFPTGVPSGSPSCNGMFPTGVPSGMFPTGVPSGSPSCNEAGSFQYLPAAVVVCTPTVTVGTGGRMRQMPGCSRPGFLRDVPDRGSFGFLRGAPGSRTWLLRHGMLPTGVPSELGDVPDRDVPDRGSFGFLRGAPGSDRGSFRGCSRPGFLRDLRHAMGCSRPGFLRGAPTSPTWLLRHEERMLLTGVPSGSSEFADVAPSARGVE